MNGPCRAHKFQFQGDSAQLSSLQQGQQRQNLKRRHAALCLLQLKALPIRIDADMTLPAVSLSTAAGLWQTPSTPGN